MISLTFDAARRVVGQHGSELAAGIGLVAVVLLVLVAVERELLRSARGAAARARVRATSPILYSLLFAFVFILGARLGRFV